MKKFRSLIVWLLLAVLTVAMLSGCAGAGEEETAVESDTLYVAQVEDLPEDFILGMDASCVPALERSGVTYYDHDGTEKDVYQILSENGINYIRVNEMMGSELHLHVEEANGDKLIVRIPTITLEDEQRSGLGYGSQVHVTCEGKVMHFFDPETQQNLLV